ncbi:hypothetical protein PS1_018960 [Malus domestica]
MKKMHIALAIPAEYREWRWLLSPLRQEKSGLPPKEEIKRIKDEALARLIAAVESATNDGEKKRSSSPAYESLAEKKPRTSYAAHGSSSGAKMLIIDLTSPKGVKQTVELELKAALKVTASIAEKLTQQKGSVMLLVSGFVSKYPSRVKSGSASKRLAAIKSGKVDFIAKVTPGHVPPTVVIDSSTKKGKSARTGNCERSTEFEAGAFLEVCMLLKANLLEDVNACAKFVNSVGKVVIRLNSLTYSMRSSLIATMHKTLILAAEFIRIDQDAIKCAKEAKVALVAQLRSAAEKIEKLESELAVLNGSDVSTPTSLQLEIAYQEVTHLNARLIATQKMLEAAEKEVSRVSPMVEDLEHVNSELRSSCFAKDIELIFMHAEVSRLKKVANKLKSKEVDLQSALSASENLKNELNELQGAHTGLVEENVQLKNEKASHEVMLASCQADFHKLGYINHLQDRPSNYKCSEKDFETFSISPVDLLDFSFEAAFGGAAEGQVVQARVVKELVVAQAAKE